MNASDLTHRKVVTERDVETALEAGATQLATRSGAILTPAARDLARKHGLVLNAAGPVAAPSTGKRAPARNAACEKLFDSPEAQAAKAEIVAVGRKLWQRQYVDGNGGNISYRLGENAVICTPTLVSKADLTPDDLCLVDLEGNQLVGARPRTSEILMHLEIYKAVPEAKAVVHCHPPHATAYAITGRVPPTCVIPEYEVFVGSVALSPYETPGTQKFAETVIPFVRKHNTVLLANHGIVCWADTVTHAEWYAEVVDTYCWTLMLSAQLGAPLTHIPPEKAADLLAIKKKLGLPDVRLDGDMKECQLCDMPDLPGAIALPAPGCAAPENAATPEDLEAIVQAVTDAVMTAVSGQAR
jgi:L-fuculose-phosphate aldolase